MNDHDELHDLWKSQSHGDTTKGKDMLTIVQKRLRRFDHRVAARNWLECIAGVALVFFFIRTAAYSPTVLMKTGSLVTAAAGAWIVFYVLRYGNSPVFVDPTQNPANYTHALVRRYEHQIRLLKSVKYWYLLPMYVGLLIMSAGLSIQRAKTGAFSWQDLRGPAIYTAVFAAIWWLNEVAAVGRLRRERTQLQSIASQYEHATPEE